MSNEHLILRLKAPMVAFGGEIIDNLGVVRDYPAASMITGLIANAFGWRRTEREKHQQLQDSLIYAAISKEEGPKSLRDFQTAQLSHSDKYWTTYDKPEGRAGGKNTYDSPHLRYRDYHVDIDMYVAIRLKNEVAVSLTDIAENFKYPRRPLFIGRKSCLPTQQIFNDEIEDAPSTSIALIQYLSKMGNKDESKKEDYVGTWRVFLPPEDDKQLDVANIKINHKYFICDERNWVSGLHGGQRQVWEGTWEWQPS